jgi:hypothetical protein
MTKIPTAVSLIPGIHERKATTHGQRIAQLMTLLQELPAEKASEELFVEICQWVLALPTTKRPATLSSAIAQAFGRTIESVDLVLRQVDRRTEFDALVPASGWLHDYIEWTRQTEPPTAFHFFVGAATLGATLGRNVSFDKGAYEVFPNLCVMIVAPSGRCRKTSACNLGIRLYGKTGGTLLADKTTPEAFVDALKTQEKATALIYAPELAVFLGKQKYNEGMVPLLTSLFDCPKEWTSKTIGRGETTLTNVALSALLCSTIDWIQTGIPKDAFGGGFMSRFLFVVQESTARSFPLPPPLNDEQRKMLISTLLRVKAKKGVFHFSPAANAWYLHWYRTRPSLRGDKQYAGYFERKPDHIIRLAMIMRTSIDRDSLELTDIDLMHAEKILHWLEEWLPSTFDEMTETATGADQARILRQLREAGGSVEHTALLRKNSTKMNSEQFRRCVGTLREAKLVEWDAPGKRYVLTPEGWS